MLARQAPHEGEGFRTPKSCAGVVDTRSSQVDKDPTVLADPSAHSAYIAVDFETTGLDPARDHLLSIAWIPIDGHWIRTDLAREIHVHSTRPAVAENAAIHGILDDARAHGEPLPSALEVLMQAAAGRVWVMHFATLERRFLDHIAHRNHLPPARFAWIDTLELALSADQRRGHVARNDAYRLPDLRQRLGLPPMPTHRALSDALATAEVWLALQPTAPSSIDVRHRPSAMTPWHGPSASTLVLDLIRCAVSHRR